MTDDGRRFQLGDNVVIPKMPGPRRGKPLAGTITGLKQDAYGDFIEIDKQGWMIAAANVELAVRA